VFGLEVGSVPGDDVGVVVIGTLERSLVGLLEGVTVREPVGVLVLPLVGTMVGSLLP
jgi:hypothetical protein